MSSFCKLEYSGIFVKFQAQGFAYMSTCNFMAGIALSTCQVARGESETNLANRILNKFTKKYFLVSAPG